MFKGIQNRVKSHPWLILLLLLGGFLRFYHLTFQSVWDDELATLIECDPSLKFSDAIKTYMEFDNMPPLYLLLMRYLFVAFGHTAFVLRVFSAIMGTAAIGAMFLLGQRLFNKNVGNAAAFIFTLNYFQIYYSQEGRPYTFLTLFTILSFYRLVVYLQQPSVKNALYYAFFTLLMLYGQYVALFMLAAQVLVLLVFLLFFEREQKVKFFLNMIPAIFIMVIGYLPALPQLLKNAAITSSWIPFPPLDVFTGYLSEFFGNSEFIVAIVYLLIIHFFVQVFATERQTSSKPIWQAMNYSFVVLVIWLVVYMLIPLIRTYTTLPILVSRYFNPLIPAICIMAGIGLTEIKNRVAQQTIVALFLCFTVVDMAIVKKYYFVPQKPQYRENAAYVLSDLKPDEPVVTTFCWHYTYFFKPGKHHTQIKYGTLDKYINQLRGESHMPESFWYMGTHEKSTNLSPENNVFLHGAYVLERRLDLHEVNAMHFVRVRENETQMQLSHFDPLTPNAEYQVLLDGSTAITHKGMNLPKGCYRLYVCAKSMPEKHVNTIPAHLSFALNGKFIGGFFVKNSQDFATQSIDFVQGADSLSRLHVFFDNDIVHNAKDRNVCINAIYLEKR